MMRSRWLLLVVLVAACGGDDSNLDAGVDAAADATSGDVVSGDVVATDASNDATDGSTSDAPASDADASAADAPSDAPTSCQKPSDCADGGPSTVCCGTLKTNGNQQSCQISTATTTCLQPLYCTTNYGTFLSCNAMTATLCSTSNDCTDSNYPTCCNAAFDGGLVHVCASSQIETFSGGVIDCP